MSAHVAYPPYIASCTPKATPARSRRPTCLVSRPCRADRSGITLRGQNSNTKMDAPSRRLTPQKLALTPSPILGASLLICRREPSVEHGDRDAPRGRRGHERHARGVHWDRDDAAVLVTPDHLHPQTPAFDLVLQPRKRFGGVGLGGLAEVGHLGRVDACGAARGSSALDSRTS